MDLGVIENGFSGPPWWLIFALAVLIIPVGGMIASTVGMYLHYRQRRDALAALKAYADSGRTPPPELVEVLKVQAQGYGSPPPGVSPGPTPGPGYGPGPGPGGPGVWGTGGVWVDPALWAGDRYARRAARRAWRAARWQYRSPYRRWTSVVWLAALAIGFGYASQHAFGETANAFLLTAIILGAATIGSAITALIATLLRP